MLRKLLATVLCGFALLLLMGAGTEPEQTAAVSADGESRSAPTYAAMTKAPEAAEDAVSAVAGTNPLTVPDGRTENLLIDGEPAPIETAVRYKNGAAYVSLAGMAKALDDTAQVTWDAETASAKVSTENLELTAKVGQFYLVANGRYLYIPEGIQVEDGRVVVPLVTLAKAFDAQAAWDPALSRVTVTRGSGAIESGDSFYDENDLFWLSRVIQRESGNQPLEGKMAVGNVVLNRVANPIFPDTVEGVLAQKNQFSTYASGALKKTKPSETSTIAAKLVMDGGVAEKVRGALWFDSTTNSWAAKHREYVDTIGGHTFYK